MWRRDQGNESFRDFLFAFGVEAKPLTMFASRLWLRRGRGQSTRITNQSQDACAALISGHDHVGRRVSPLSADKVEKNCSSSHTHIIQLVQQKGKLFFSFFCAEGSARKLGWNSIYGPMVRHNPVPLRRLSLLFTDST